MNLRRILSIAVLVATASVATASAAAASPVSDKQAQAAQLQAQLDANGEKLSAAAEAYNGARLKVTQTEEQIGEAQARIAANEKETNRLRDAVNDRAAAVYIQAAVGGNTVETGDYAARAAASKYASSATSRDEKVVKELAASIERLNADRARLDTARAQAVAERDQAEKQRNAVESLNAQQARLLGQVKGDLARLIKEQEQQRIAAAQASSAGRSTGTAPGRTGNSTPPARPGGGGGDFPSNLPAPSASAGAAIAFARSQLGKPYEYAAAGPDSYDCSGLTMRAWGAAGVSMPHYSGAQYAMFPHVPLDQLAPGDLVFRGPGGSQHVALYIGNGLVIHAPQTGDVVKVAPMGSVIGAARPG
ncbi:MAG: NlpC/P60 family protein [Acidimicrobiia bacterium]